MSKERLEKKTTWWLSLVTIFALATFGIILYTSNVNSKINIWDLGVFFRSSWIFSVYFLLLVVFSVFLTINTKDKFRFLGILLTIINIIALFVITFFFSTAGGWNSIF